MFFKKWGKKEAVSPADYSLLTLVGSIPITLVERSKAFEEWSRRAANFEQTRSWPLLLGRPDKLHEFAVDDEWFAEVEDSPESIIKEAMSVDLEQFLEDRMADVLPDEEEEDAEDILAVDVQGLDLRSESRTHLVAIEGLSDSKHTQVALAEFPCDAPWKVLSVRPLCTGEGPSDAALTAVLKSWYERFGAVPVGYPPGTVLELWLANPITEPEVAKTVALEMFAVCPDIVYQGTDTVHRLAQELLNASSWFLWWD